MAVCVKGTLIAAPAGYGKTALCALGHIRAALRNI
jgi:ATP/maltotriose-dependent transcriptional regulator MalT